MIIIPSKLKNIIKAVFNIICQMDNLVSEVASSVPKTVPSGVLI